MSFSISIKSIPIPKENASLEELWNYFNLVFKLTPSRSNQSIGAKLFEIFVKSAKIKSGSINGINVINGSLKVQDLIYWLNQNNCSLTKTQLYNTYLSSLLDSNLIIKKGPNYYLNGGSLEQAFMELKFELEKQSDKLIEVAKRCDYLLEKN